jgi:hypothetical protein
MTVTELSRKPRALLCKPSSDGVSRKLRAFMQIRQIYTEFRVRAVGNSSGKEAKRKQGEETDKDKEAQNSSR